jgi:two-component system sensor histidine kinase AlgZ
VASISEKPQTNGLPDFSNLGVVLRVVLGVNLLGLMAALLMAPRLGVWLGVFVDLSFRLQPVLLVSLLLFFLSNRLLRLMSAWGGRIAVVGGVITLTLALEDVWSYVGLVRPESGHFLRVGLLAAGVAAVMLGYFSLRAQAAASSVDAARVAALTARIRPHFLFNSLNAVLSLIRAEPRRAEEALENLAELFRALMKEPRELVPLSEEIALCRQYLELERLRLGDRLRVVWTIDDMPPDAKVPPLLLQPLIENAVYHGIEPADEGGEVRIHLLRRGAGVRIELWNPLCARPAHAQGNHLALANIRERLSLFYDLEARLDAAEADGGYRVRIDLPLKDPHALD